LAALFGIITGLLTFVALLLSPGPALYVGLAAALAATICGVLWFLAAIRDDP
jgi:hypothetical protein